MSTPPFDLSVLLARLRDALDTERWPSNTLDLFVVREHALLAAHEALAGAYGVQLVRHSASGSTIPAFATSAIRFDQYSLLHEGVLFDFQGVVDEQCLLERLGDGVLEEYAHDGLDPGQTHWQREDNPIVQRDLVPDWAEERILTQVNGYLAQVRATTLEALTPQASKPQRTGRL